MIVKNLFSNLPTQTDKEYFENLVVSPSFKLERIISFGSSSAESPWYDQDKDEWVMVAKGQAILEFSGSGKEISLESGDYLLIKAGERHRVKWTDPAEETIWLALHF